MTEHTHTHTRMILRENSAGLQVGSNIPVNSWIFLSPEFGVDYFALCSINITKIVSSTPIHISWEL